MGHNEMLIARALEGRRDRLQEALGAFSAPLSEFGLAAIEAAVPRGAVAGERKDPRVLATMDSERG